MTRRRDPSDRTETEWAELEPVHPAAKRGGRPRTPDLRAVCNASFSLADTGCPWRNLPQEYPPWQTVYA